MLMILLPLTRQEDRDVIANQVVKDAIALKIDLASEHAAYYYYWVNSGDKFDGNIIEAPEGRPTDQVHVCTFPGLARFMDFKEGHFKDFKIVKASAIIKHN